MTLFDRQVDHYYNIISNLIELNVELNKYAKQEIVVYLSNSLYRYYRMNVAIMHTKYYNIFNSSVKLDINLNEYEYYLDESNIVVNNINKI